MEPLSEKIASAFMMEKHAATASARQDLAERQVRIVRLRDLIAIANAVGAGTELTERKLSLAEIQFAERMAMLRALEHGARH